MVHCPVITQKSKGDFWPLQIVQATTAMYGCSSNISWNPIAYIPVVNNAALVARSQHVANQLTAVKRFELLERPTFMAEDIAFFNGKP